MSIHQKIIDKEIWQPAAGNPVISRGPEGSWDSSAVLDPCIAAVGEGADGEGYALWYGGRLQTENPEQGKRVNAQVGYAFSSDGIAWEKRNSISPRIDSSARGNNVLPPIRLPI